MAVPLGRYLAVAELDLSTRESCEGCLRAIVPALGKMELRKLRGPVLGTFYAKLRRCGDLGFTGRPFAGHGKVPVLRVGPRDRRPGWRQIAGTIAEAVIAVRRGRTAVVTGPAGGDAVAAVPRPRARAGAGHDCARAGCRQHECRPMTAKTIRNIHAIVSGAVRWEWIGSNPAGHRQAPQDPPAPPARHRTGRCRKGHRRRRDAHPALAVYLWLAAITGGRRGELCGPRFAPHQ